MDRIKWYYSFLVTALTISVLRGSRTCPDTWTVFRDSCYLFDHGIPLSFYEAEAFCRQHGGHLVHVDDEIENLFLKDNLRALKPHNFWMGLTDERIEKVWVWYDTNTSPEYTDWGPGEPNTYHAHNEDCAEFKIEFDYRWNDALCNSTNEVICEISGDGTDAIIG